MSDVYFLDYAKNKSILQGMKDLFAKSGIAGLKESFFKLPKHEEVYLSEYDTFADVAARLPRFIKEVHDQKRLQLALGCRSPNDFEDHLNQEQQPMPRQTLLTLPV